MGHSYEKSKKIATKIILILGAITIFEVLFALAGKGYIVEGWHFPVLIMALAMITMSLIKAYLIVYEFMHMKYEVPGLGRSVLLPTLLLVWGVIAFFAEGKDWQKRRNLIINNDKIEIQDPVIRMSSQSGMHEETKHIHKEG